MFPKFLILGFDNIVSPPSEVGGHANTLFPPDARPARVFVL